MVLPFGTKKLEIFIASKSDPPGFERKSKTSFFIPLAFKSIKAFFTSEEALLLNRVKVIYPVSSFIIS